MTHKGKANRRLNQKPLASFGLRMRGLTSNTELAHYEPLNCY
jgi:hypothetical protein